jgi:tRNA(Arg) A34 adenosine deaminase TadA
MKVAADSVPASREQFMRVALKMAERGMAAGGPPVGACLVRGNDVIASSHNQVVSDLDITAHAEVVAIRSACAGLRTLALKDCTLYVSVEPCPMCLAASHYAGIREIVFGASLADMQAITGTELCVSAAQLFSASPHAPAVAGGVLAAESCALLTTWSSGLGGRRS